MFQKVLIANRGEIACRIIKTARRLGCTCVAVYSDADKDAMHVAMADEAHRIGPPPASESYLRIDRIIGVAKLAGVDAIHPGYGFVSESPEFAEACEGQGLVFIGPSAAAIRAMGHKDTAKRLVEKVGLAVVPGYDGESQDVSVFAEHAEQIGYPVMIKAIAGGGGRGMRRVDDPKALQAAFEAAKREAAASFGDDRLLLEKFIAGARHIEVQVFADMHGHGVHLFERDCSLQRRHQKVIEEAPAPGMTPSTRHAIGEAAVRAAVAVGYRGAGTVEFIVDPSGGLNADKFYFMEMNTRLQVEHCVTEMITGQDLVEWQFRVAAGEPLPLTQNDLSIDGHAFEARIYAEDADHGFLPQTGRITCLHLPHDEARVETAVRRGDEITSYYDPMIAKIVTHGETRAVALNKLSHALRQSCVLGCTTNISFLIALAAHADVIAGKVDVGLIEREIKALTAARPTDVTIAIAALAALDLLRDRDIRDPWTALVGWRAWGEAEYSAELRWRGAAISARIISHAPAKFRIELPTSKLTCTLMSRNRDKLFFDFGNCIIEAVVVETERGIGICIDGSTHTFTRPPAPDASAESGPVSGRLVSPITGLIASVNVAPESRVSKGMVLIVIEAMKMEHSIIAPHEGIIAEVFVAAGDRVAEGAVLLNLASEGGATDQQ